MRHTGSIFVADPPHMEQFIVSARKYRPVHFDQVVGQSAITGTLKNALANDHLAQAFLFCGPRGVGKTTCARILARTINCFNITEHTEACGECDSCKSFDEGHSLNIYELDAASNNSVDDIRNLIDQVRLAPQIGSHKVYIIDEVHMLSQAAFNAFLKTLEEPPAHAIFILATTEKHKIIPTILSRCQIFDFKRIQVTDMAAHLADVAKKENVAAEPDALHLIAQKADGGLRDALSIFDQIVSYSGSELKYQHVLENLNVLDHDHYFKITESVLAGDVPTILLGFDKILDQGFDGHLFLNGLGAHFRDLLVSGHTSTIGLLEAGEKLSQRYLEQAARCASQALIDGLEIISQADVKYKASKDQRLLVELMLIKLCQTCGKPSAEKSTPTEEKERPSSEAAEPERARPQVVAATQPKVEQAPPKPAPQAAPQAPLTLSPSITPAPPKTEAVAEAPAAEAKQETAPLQQAPPEVAVVEEEREPIKKPTAPKAPIDMPSKGPMASLSINSMLSAKKHEEKEQEVLAEKKSSARDPFTNEALNEIWNAYALKRKEDGKNSLHATLIHQKPVLAEDWSITFPILNEVQEKDLQQEGPELLAHLRSAFNNYGIELNWKKAAFKEQKKVLTNDQERFEKLVKKNPTLLKLKDALDLQVGY